MKFYGKMGEGCDENRQAGQGELIELAAVPEDERKYALLKMLLHFYRKRHR